jgi:hypothetical protein
MKPDHTMRIYKRDRRTKSGERLVSTTVWRHRDSAEMAREVRELHNSTWPQSQGFRIEFVPTMKTVRNLITGQLVEISPDRPRACDPSSELFWTR